MCALIEKFEKFDCHLCGASQYPLFSVYKYKHKSNNKSSKILKWCGQALLCSKMAEGSGGGIRQTAAGNQAYGDEAVSAAKRLSIRREGGAYGNEKAEHTVMEKRDI